MITPDVICQLFVDSVCTNAAARNNATTQIAALIASVDRESGFVQALIQVMTASPDAGPFRGVPSEQFDAMCLSAAINFKNLIKAGWNPETSDHLIMDNDKSFVREGLFDVVVNAPKLLHRQLEEALHLIAVVDFPRQWPNLLGLMLQRLQWCFDAGQREVPADKLHNAERCMSAIHAVLRKYRENHSELTEEIAPEFQRLHDDLCRPLLACLTAAHGAISRAISDTSNRDGEALARTACKFAASVVEVIHCIVFLDVSDRYVDMLPAFAVGFANLLGLKCPAIEQSRENVGSLADVKIKTLSLVALHIQKYAEEVRQGVPQLASAARSVLNPQSEDNVVISVIQFLEHIARSQMLASYLAPMVDGIIDSCIMPNVELDDYDVDMFEEDPTDYIEHDVEGSDQWTRRRAATELIRALLFEFSDRVAPKFRDTVMTMLNQYHGGNKRHLWKLKDGAIFLVTALATQGTASSTRGTVGDLSNVYSPQQLKEFFETQVLSELNTDEDNQELPTHAAILKASSIRFVSTFRKHIGEKIDSYYPLLACLAKWLLNSNRVIFSYAAHAIDRLLSDPRGVPLDGPNMSSLASLLLFNICMRLSKERAPNEHLVRALSSVLRSCSTQILEGEAQGLGPNAPTGQPLAALAMFCVNGVLAEAMKNPSNAQFTHFLYECIAWTIRRTPQLARSIEDVIWENLMLTLQQNVVEMMPYSLQIVAQLLDTFPPGQPTPDRYSQLLVPLLSPQMMQDKGNVPAVVRLAGSFLRQCGRSMLSGDRELVARLFSMTTELIASKTTDTDGFMLLVTLMGELDDNAASPHVKNVLGAMLTRLQNSRTLKFERAGILGLSAIVSKYGAGNLAQMLESMQSGLFPMLLTRFVFQCAQKVTSRLGRKCALMLLSALADTLAEAAAQQGPQMYCDCVVVALQLINSMEQKVEQTEAFKAGRSGSNTLRTQTSTALARANSGAITPTMPSAPSSSWGPGNNGNELMSAAESRTATLAETGFTNTFCPLQGAQRDPDDPFPMIENSLQHFLSTVRSHVSGPNGGQFAAALQNAVPREAMGMLTGA